ncbi:MAG: hypothetical protein RR311_00815 [Comamonas sp.]
MLQGQGQHLRAGARDLLRALVAGYLGTAPEKTPLHFVPGQAPFVDLDWQGMALSISMSYSQDLALIAICPGAHIGIDVTEIAPMPDWAQVAKLYLGVESIARLAANDGMPRDRMFALAWAELEARCKCVGLGLQEWSPARHKRLHADSIEVSTTALGGLRSGLTYALALARDSAT